jgi:hypothetical protein
MTPDGVVAVFFEKTSAIITASASVRQTIRHVWSASTILSSWQRRPMAGIGRDAGNLRRLDLAVQPDERLAGVRHDDHYMS